LGFNWAFADSVLNAEGESRSSNEDETGKCRLNAQEIPDFFSFQWQQARSLSRYCAECARPARERGQRQDGLGIEDFPFRPHPIETKFYRDFKEP
jgi:hypothetical protein